MVVMARVKEATLATKSGDTIAMIVVHIAQEGPLG